MSQLADRSSPEHRLRLLRFGLIIVTAVAFALATGIGFFSTGGQVGGAALQGALWGVGAAIVSVLIYMVYKSAVVKS
jgi:hypothetical protein